MDKIHLKAPRGWINDPNGFIYYNGKYHIFYQHFPYAPKWGRMHWGHAVSDDLASWEHLNVALYPTKDGDADGCFSGSAIEKDGKMHIFYTGVKYLKQNPENVNCSIGGCYQCQMHIVSDDGFEFDNLDRKNTVIPVSKNFSVINDRDARDPKVWQGKDGSYYMILGTTVDKKGRFAFFRSTDLESWEYVAHATAESLGRMWECPDYFEVNDQGVVIFSPMGLENGNQTVVMLASFEEKSCEMTLSEDYTFLDYGFELYAPQSTVDKNGNRVVVAWLRMPKNTERKTNGMFCIPRLCTVENGKVKFRPHTDVLCKFTKKINSPSDSDSKIIRIKTTLTEGGELNACGYKIKAENGKIVTDRSSLTDGKNTISESPLLSDGYELDVYINENIVEVYINNGECVITNAVYGLTNEISGASCDIYTVE